MKAFLSHSSNDKIFVEKVAEGLRPGSYELDSLTFEKGVLNSSAIFSSLKRCQIFVLFLSKYTIDSSYVKFEEELSLEFKAKGALFRILIFCLDEEGWQSASEKLKINNVILRADNPDEVARYIYGVQTVLIAQFKSSSHPFIGRKKEIQDLELQYGDFNRPIPKAFFISGNYGAGRRTLIKKFYQNQYSHVNQNIQEIIIDNFGGMPMLHRHILSSFYPSLRVIDYQKKVNEFQNSSIVKQKEIIADLLNTLLDTNEAVIFIANQEGLLDDDTGKLNDDINDIVNLLKNRPHPLLIFISSRMTPKQQRRTENDIIYLALYSMDQAEASSLIANLCKEKDINLNHDSLEKLVDLSGCHPFNIYYLVDEINEKGLDLILENPIKFAEWKHRQYANYLSRVLLNEIQKKVLFILNTITSLDFSTLTKVLASSSKDVSDALYQLIDLHIVEINNELFSISPALKNVVDRDSRLRISGTEETQIIGNIANSLELSLEKGTAPISLVEANILSNLKSGNMIGDFAAAFLLPSHEVLMAKYYYDRREWNKSIKFAKNALQGKNRLSDRAIVSALSHLCLCGSRMQQEDVFQEGINGLKALKKSQNLAFLDGHLAFLNGFHARIKGQLLVAEQCFRSCLTLSKKNWSATRELASICLALKKYEDAEKYAREAYTYAHSNHYLIDILISVLIPKYKDDRSVLKEIDDLFSILEKSENEDGHSFYTTRKAEFEHLYGNNREALRLIKLAIKKTPNIFEPRQIYISILLDEKKISEAREAIEYLRTIFNQERNVNSNKLRQFCEIQFEFFKVNNQWEDAKNIISNKHLFTDEEITRLCKDADMDQSYKKQV